MVGLFAAAAFRVIPSANRILMALQALKYATPVIELMNQEIHHPESKLPEISSDLLFRNQIVLNKLHYHYPGTETPAIKRVSLTIEKGDTIGIIGTSGAGKSTLIDLFLGLVVPSSGSIKVDGFDIIDNVRGWQRNLGYVPQQIYLTDDTLRRNIAFGLQDSEISEVDVRRTLEQAQLLDFVKSIPDGLDTRVGERGVRLSGGQLQRVGIARALYTNPSILVLDEASSALDVKTEETLMESVNALAEFITLIIVTHRHSTLQNCNRVYTIEKGEIVDISHR
jgi:ABC-type bacteriocin/lantibiotic exporter with double-glycine peptidase domain